VDAERLFEHRESILYRTWATTVTSFFGTFALLPYEHILLIDTRDLHPGITPRLLSPIPCELRIVGTSRGA
jgi:hypothetical protein